MKITKKSKTLAVALGWILFVSFDYVSTGLKSLVWVTASLARPFKKRQLRSGRHFLDN